MAKLTSMDDWKLLQKDVLERRDQKRAWISVCDGTGCRAAKASSLIRAIERELLRLGLTDQVGLRQTGCFGLCERGPVVTVTPLDVYYFGVRAHDAAELVERTILKGEVVERLLYRDKDGTYVRRLQDIPFYQRQRRVLLGRHAQIDPRSLEDYVATGGYQALARALFELSPDEIIQQVDDAGLRGRGGGGFHAARKWRASRQAPGEPKYVIVNGDEGDPGAYMDRSLLEGNPHGVLEGLIIGALAVGAREGVIYVRQEYPLAVERVTLALEQARAYGLLGKGILGSDFDFDLSLHLGAGAFVSGESTALMSAIEGKAGQPRPKYVHTSERGLWGKPTVLNNVETWANIPHIIERGPEWFRRMGSPDSPGTKIFSLVGKVRNSGLVEVPMGITLREILYDIGGGVRGDKRFKAIQTGGPSGGFLPASALDLPVDFDALTAAGSMMGSGGMIVLDEDTCMVDATRFYVDFLAHESCGQCIPCREGLRQMLRILDNITSGHGHEGDLELLEELCELLEKASMCALGRTAANPVRSALRHFRPEFEAHIRDKQCPAMVCTELFHYQIDASRCPGCLLCLKACPTKAIVGARQQPHVIDQTLCNKCGNCFEVCPAKCQAVVRGPGPAPAVRPQRPIQIQART